MTTVRRHRLSSTALPAALVALTAAGACLAAPPCDGSSDPCTLDLGRATVTFGQGAASYSAGAEQVSGGDSYYAAFAEFPSTLAPVHGTDHDGFSFVPQVYASVGGGGIDGFHEVAVWFEFRDVVFDAKPGWRLDRIAFTAFGSYGTVGDGYVTFGLMPAAPSLTADTFRMTTQLDPADASVRAGFTTAASYLQDPPTGGATLYGTANAAFGGASFLAYVSAVPESGRWLLTAAGLAALGLVRRFRAA